MIVADEDDDDVVVLMKGLPDLSALSGILRSVSSTARSSPEPPYRSGCTAAQEETIRVKKTPHPVHTTFHSKIFFGLFISPRTTMNH